MTYRYLIRYKIGKKYNKLSVEAWPKNKQLATNHELRKPSFVIGSLKGERIKLVQFIVKDLINKYGAKQTKTGFIIHLPPNNTEDIITAYRTGLLLASLSKTRKDEEADNIIRYIYRCTPEEIWFWTSKYLGIIRDDTTPEKVIQALTILAK